MKQPNPTYEGFWRETPGNPWRLLVRGIGTASTRERLLIQCELLGLIGGEFEIRPMANPNDVATIADVTAAMAQGKRPPRRKLKYPRVVDYP